VTAGTTVVFVTFSKELLKPDDVVFKSHNETINHKLPMRSGSRKAIAVSDAHTVEGDADG
jgi:hypothetical protein